MVPLTRRRLRWVLPRLGVLLVTWGTLTGAVFSGCRGLFTPATPEPPEGRPIEIDLRTPEATIRTMTLGIEAKGQGASAWLAAFADSGAPEDGPGFHMIFDPDDVRLFESACGCQAPTTWRTSQEQAFFLEFIAVRPSDDYRVLIETVEERPDPTPGDTQTLMYRRYRFLAIAPDGNSTQVIAVGYADLTFTKVASDRWLITRWEDHVDPSIGVNPSDPEQVTLGRRRMESTR